MRRKFPDQFCASTKQYSTCAQLDSTTGTIDGMNGKLGRVYQNKTLPNKLEGKHLGVWTGDRIVPMQVSSITDIIFNIGSSRHRRDSTPTLHFSPILLKFLSDWNAENVLLTSSCLLYRSVSVNLTGNHGLGQIKLSLFHQSWLDFLTFFQGQSQDFKSTDYAE